MPPNKTREAHTYTTSKSPGSTPKYVTSKKPQGVLTYKSAAMNWSGLHDRKIRSERTLLFSVRSVRILFVMLYDTLHTSLICMRFLDFSKTTYLHALPGLFTDCISSCAPGLPTYSICSANMRQKLISSRMQDPQITGTP